MNTHPYAKTIWDLLLADIKNEKGVSALMGNLQAESGLYPDRVQGDVPYSNYSKEYTAKVDSGVINVEEFIHNGPNGGGYGLAQWTYYTRKLNLYNTWKSGGYPSIGNVNLACDFLLIELKNSFPDVYTLLKYCTTIREASDYVLHEFENPADQSTVVEELRASMGTEIYNTFSGTSPGNPDNPDTPVIPTPQKQKGMSKLLLYAFATDLF